jgi:hypothetical protein
MRQLSSILVALLLSVPVVAGAKRPGKQGFDARQSVALFVGVRDFTDESLEPVPYAIDDAVDLACELALDHDPVLVAPNRVILALSKGEPQKPESRQKLARLLASGATRVPAERKEITQSLEEQAKRVGRDGMVIVSFATHGVSGHETQHLLTASSRLNPLADTVTDKEISSTLWSAEVPRSLVLIDACREHLTRDRRGRADARSAFSHVMTGVEGQVTISGAPIGGWAYDDDERKNGVFTATIIAGLQCGAAKDWHHFVTVETLNTYVSREVLRWVRAHRNPHARRATQLTCEGVMRKMPLSICVNRTAAADAPVLH